MRIAIIGAGISGLTLYLWLSKFDLTSDDQHSIAIYERHATPSTSSAALDEEGEQSYSASLVGGSLGLGANGLRVLRNLDEGLYDEVIKTGSAIRCWRLSSARGFTLARVGVEGEEGAVMIGRDDFVSILRRRAGDGVVKAGKVVGVGVRAGGAKVLRFEDGTEEEAGLVVGADGIWSAVRRSMFHGEGGPDVHTPHYEGLVGVGSFVPARLMEGVPEGEMNVVFGRNGFFGYGIDRDPDSGRGRGVCWSTYTLDELPEDWRRIDVEGAQSQLRARHCTWKNDVIQRIITQAKVDRVWPTFTTPALPTWEKDGCVLLGDAAHALQPSSGQGTGMALEDAEALARLLAHHLGGDPEAGHLLACKQYSELRRPRLAKIHKKAQQLGSMKMDMSVVREYLMYFFIWAMATFGIGKEYNDFVYGYDVQQEVEALLSRSRERG